MRYTVINGTEWAYPDVERRETEDLRARLQSARRFEELRGDILKAASLL